MNWGRGFVVAGLISGASIAYTAYAMAMIMWLGGWGVVLTLVPVFFMMAFAIAGEG